MKLLGEGKRKKKKGRQRFLRQIPCNEYKSKQAFINGTLSKIHQLDRRDKKALHITR